jgi:hypothetical protein
MSKKKLPQDTAEKIHRYLRAREAGKRGYERADRIIHEIAKDILPGTEIQLNDSGRKAVLHDRFEDFKGKDIIWTPCAARRWELEIIEP